VTDYHHGFSHRKANFLEHFLQRNVRRLGAGVPQSLTDRLYVWGDAAPPEGQRFENVVHVEDGFLRSVGLGAAFAEPVSWVLDRQGLHHWGAHPSDLEDLIRSAPGNPEATQRGEALLKRIRAARLTKYNTGASSWTPPAAMLGRKQILVIGQVGNDAALRGITTPVRTNMDLLESVRAREEGAFIIYKRHPDVSAGYRDGFDAEATRFADLVVEDVALDAILPWTEEVHVMTSLTGFEALIRGVRVVCHAWPFYSGWGLTTDVYPNGRRAEKRSMEQIAGAALVSYPLYRDPATKSACTPERALEYLIDKAEQARKQTRLTPRAMWRDVVAKLARGLRFTDRAVR